jgi:hypothetical protein
MTPRFSGSCHSRHHINDDSSNLNSVLAADLMATLQFSSTCVDIWWLDGCCFGSRVRVPGWRIKYTSSIYIFFHISFVTLSTFLLMLLSSALALKPSTLQIETLWECLLVSNSSTNLISSYKRSRFQPGKLRSKKVRYWCLSRISGSRFYLQRMSVFFATTMRSARPSGSTFKIQLVGQSDVGTSLSLRRCSWLDSGFHSRRLLRSFSYSWWSPWASSSWVLGGISLPPTFCGRWCLEPGWASHSSSTSTSQRWSLMG